MKDIRLNEAVALVEEPDVPREPPPKRTHEKVRPDPAAIKNLERIQETRALKPPGRS